MKPPTTFHPLREPESFQRALTGWFRREGKVYPWRQTRDPYAILVSEIMLQQTQVSTVLERGYFSRWMARFPDVESLARASEDEVLKAWEGLGYYRRARNLHALAGVLVREHGGRLPNTLEDLLGLPGIGPYTAGAVLAFAHDRSAALVDGNVQRVLARVFDFAGEVDAGAGRKQIWSWAEMLVPSRHSRLYNSGLMELGQRVCRPALPECESCPVSEFCQTRSPESLPRKTARRATVFLDEHVWFHERAGQLRLIREEGTRRRGLWKLPECPPVHRRQADLLYRAKYSITHHRVTLHVYRSRLVGGREATGGHWIPLDEVRALALAAPYRKAVDQLLSRES